MFLRFALRRYNPARPLFAGNLFRFAKKDDAQACGALAGREAVQEFHGAGVVAEYFFFLAKTA